MKEKSVELSKAEKRVYDLLVLGFTYPQIAEKIYRSLRAVKFQTYSIYKKLGVKTKGELIVCHYIGKEEFERRRSEA